jgi:pimeloyl-ACP methyl ester carboxylesterase
MDHLEVDGLQIAYRRRGAGPPLVLLHGAVCDGRVWRVELDAFADTFTVVAWDAPGCGGSSDPPDGFAMDDFARCLAGFVEQLGLGPAHVLGHSWGSALALQLAHQRPELVRTMVLVGAYAGWAGSLPPDEVRHRLEVAHRLADSIGTGLDPTAVPGLFSDVMPADRATELGRIMGEIRPTGTRVMAEALAASDQRDLLPSIDVPILLVCGADDVRSPMEVGEHLHRALRHSTLTVLPGLGHECYLEDAGAFDAVVRSFLGGHLHDQP